jgi:hypothetical protein
VSSEVLVAYDYFPYGSTKNFSFKVDMPGAAAACGWTVDGATFY